MNLSDEPFRAENDTRQGLGSTQANADRCRNEWESGGRSKQKLVEKRLDSLAQSAALLWCVIGRRSAHSSEWVTALLLISSVLTHPWFVSDVCAVGFKLHVTFHLAEAGAEP